MSEVGVELCSAYGLIWRVPPGFLGLSGLTPTTPALDSEVAVCIEWADRAEVAVPSDEVIVAGDGRFSPAVDGWVHVALHNGLQFEMSASDRRIRCLHAEAAGLAHVVGALVHLVLPLYVDLVGKLACHGALVAQREGPGVLLLGASGTGKSTLALAAATHPEWRLGDDDCAILVATPDSVTATPSTPGLRVRPDTADGLLGSDDATLPPSPIHWKQVAVPGVHLPTDAFFTEPIDLDSVVRLRPNPDPSASIEIMPTPAGEAVAAIARSLFKIPSLGIVRERERFESAVDIASRTSLIDLHYPRRFDALRGVLDTLAEHA